MLRILIWRLLYHYFCLLKSLGYRGKKVFYFAFGANLDPNVLATRNIQPHSQINFTLSDYTIKFNHEIPFKKAAMASIEKSKNQNNSWI